MKPHYNKILLMGLVLISGYGVFSSCTHKDQVLPAAAVPSKPIITHGHHVHLPGLTAGDSTQWKFDKVHSAVNWSTPFLEVGADLTGKFNQFGVADLSAAQMQTYTVTGQPVADTSWAFYENE